MSYREWKALVDRKLTIRQIAAETGLGYSTVRYWLGKHKLKTAGKTRHAEWDVAAFTTACAQSDSIRQVLVRMGAGDTANEYRYARQLAEELGVSLPVYDGSGKSPRSSLTDEELFSFGSERSNVALRRRLIRVGVPYVCVECDQGPEWCGRPITLQVDHIDGDRLNNLMENLRFLCPNCHSQTPTFSGRNRAKKAQSALVAQRI